MDSRSFAIGLVCGVVAGALAVWLIGSSRHQGIPGVKQEAEATNTPDMAAIAPPVKREPQDLPNGNDPEDSEPRRTAETNSDPVAPWPENQRAKLRSEPKDESWAYYMEQTLLQFLSAHPSIDQYDISSIECRTTMCQIEVFGFDESTYPVWQQVMYDINQQPSSEFGQYGTGTGNIGGRVMIFSTLHRKSEP